MPSMLILGACSFVALALLANSPPPEQRAVSLLRIQELPTSVAELDCWSRGIEDDHTWCTGKASVADMGILMSGWPFEAKPPIRRTPWSKQEPFCGNIPDRSEKATHCFIYRSEEFGFQGAGFMAFSYDEKTGWFYAETIRS